MLEGTGKIFETFSKLQYFQMLLLRFIESFRINLDEKECQGKIVVLSIVIILLDFYLRGLHMLLQVLISYIVFIVFI